MRGVRERGEGESCIGLVHFELLEVSFSVGMNRKRLWKN